MTERDLTTGVTDADEMASTTDGAAPVTSPVMDGTVPVILRDSDPQHLSAGQTPGPSEHDDASVEVEEATDVLKVKPNKFTPEEMEEFGSILKIDPKEKSFKVNKNRLESIRNSAEGFLFLVRYQESIQILIITTTIVLGIALLLGVPLTHFVILLVAFGGLWVCEALNTSVEAVVDLVAPDYRDLAKVSKDVGAAAAFIATVLASIVTLLLLVPPLLRVIGTIGG